MRDEAVSSKTDHAVVWFLVRAIAHVGLGRYTWIWGIGRIIIEKETMSSETLLFHFLRQECPVSSP
jgi:hypothetical protein